MARKGIHPDYHTITVQMTDGSKYLTRSTYGKEGDIIQLDVDPKTHPAWVGGVNLRKTGRLESFNNRFGGIAAINKSPNAKAEVKAETKTEAKKEEKKDDAASA
jgi:large subunit ribosomal protein L31